MAGRGLRALTYAWFVATAGVGLAVGPGAFGAPGVLRDSGRSGIMDRTLSEPIGRGVEKIVARFEAAWIVEGEANLAAFLPEVGHRDRAVALLELVAVDLERRRADGRPRPLEDYLLEFPELCSVDLGELARAEPTPGSGSGWPASRPSILDRPGVRRP